MGFADILALLEHLPRVGSLLSKLLPMLENQRPGNGAPATVGLDEDSRIAMEQLRGTIQQATAAHAVSFRKMTEQGEEIAAAAADARAAKLAAEAAEARATAIEKKLGALMTLLGISFVGILAVIVLAVLLLLRHH
jgi:hypothetical protein